MPNQFQQITSVTGLEAGWRRVLRNKGAPGIDGVTVNAFRRKSTAALSDLSRELRVGIYRPRDLRICEIAKKSGGVRRLAIPCVRDRIVQSSAHLVLSQLLNERLASASYAYRPERGVKEAVAAARRFIAGGRHYVLDADIEGFFDTVPHRRLMADLSIWPIDRDTTRLIAGWLAAAAPSGVGLPQGGPISPLLANLYLHPLDKLTIDARTPIVRYADDFLVFARSAAELAATRTAVASTLEDRGLALHPKKTHLRGPGDTVHFLGERLDIPAALNRSLLSRLVGALGFNQKRRPSSAAR